MKQFSYHSAQVRVQVSAGGMHSASYSGFLSGRAWHHLGQEVANDRARGRARFCAERFHAAAMGCRLHLCNFDFLSGTPPGIWVVRQDQYEDASMMARRLADRGITRSVFLQEFEVLALELAELQCPVAS